MSKYLSDRIRRMELTPYERVVREFMGIQGAISLLSGDPDFPTPEHITRAAVEALREGWTKYPPIPGYEDLRRAVAEYHGRYGVEWNANNVLPTPGSSQALFLCLEATLKEGDEVILPTPTYLDYFRILRYFGAKIIEVPMVEEGWRLHLEGLKEAVSEKTKMIIACNPNNPTGTVYTREEVRCLADLAVERDLLVVSDEVYNEFLFDGRRHLSLAAEPGMRERTMVILSFSKTFAMTGWRLGFVIADEEFIRGLQRIPIGFRPSSFIQRAAIAALKGAWDDVRRMAEEYDKRRRFMTERLNEMEGVKCQLPEGAFYVFPSFRDRNLKSLELVENLAKRGKILVHPGLAFGEAGEYHIRIPLVKPIEELEKVAETLESILRGLKGGG
ncbi:MAG: aminotransferase class I/II-fold pyridoxal phosphate-dependent enzyme [Candidatus Bathyarchaeia archaeon]